MSRGVWGGLLAAALATRLAAVCRTALISTDGANFFCMAQAFVRGRFLDALAQDQHPLYPALVAPFHAVGLAPLAALSAVTLLATAALFVLVRRLAAAAAGPAAAVWAAALFAVHPLFVANAADFLSETPALVFMAAGLLLADRWRARPSWRLEAAVGGICGWGYLVRQDAVEVLIGVAVVAALAWRRGDLPTWTVARAALLSGLAFLIVVSPYLVYLRCDEGRWMISRKKDLGALFPWFAPDYTVHPEAPPLGIVNPLLAVRVWIQTSAFWYELQKTLVGAFHPVVLTAAVVGGWLAWRARRRLWMGAFFWIHVAVLAVLLNGAGYVEKRHALFAVLTALPWAGEALARLSRARVAGWPVGRAAAFACVALLLPQTFEARRADAENRLAYRALGEAIAVLPLGPGAVAAPRDREGIWTAFYAAAGSGRRMLLYDARGGRLPLTPRLAAESAAVLSPPDLEPRAAGLLAGWREVSCPGLREALPGWRLLAPPRGKR